MAIKVLPTANPEPLRVCASFGFSLGFGTVTDLGAPGLEILAVGAGRDFSEGVLPREPDFDVVSFGGAEAHVARAQAHDTVGEFQELEDSSQHFGSSIRVRRRIFQAPRFSPVPLFEIDADESSLGYLYRKNRPHFESRVNMQCNSEGVSQGAKFRHVKYWSAGPRQ